ncbi:MAG: magnesium chelatase domain-containing protein [Patescibacteria group bacterium]
MMLSISSIFTIQTDSECAANIVAIETLITKGIYKFTLLGMPTKTASDSKDRVYSALRSSGLLNLKSDNRKIIVNITPENTLKKEGFYDLGIAISCISCIDTQIPDKRALILGGLSISGQIIPTERIKHAVYAAYTHNISVILCSQADKSYLSDHTLEKLGKCGIYIIAADSLREIIDLYKQNSYSLLPAPKKYEEQSEYKDANDNIDIENMDHILRALCISISGGHHILIETPLTPAIKQLSADMCTFTAEKHFGREAYSAYRDKKLDSDQKINILYLENVKTYSKNYIQGNQLSHKDSIVALYTPCTCGYQYTFFEANTQEKKCICSQRSILQHKRHIESTYFDIFNIHISNTQLSQLKQIDKEHIKALHQLINQVRHVQFIRHSRELKLTEQEIFMFPDNLYLNIYRNIDLLMEDIDQGDRDLFENHSGKENLLRIARTIQDIFDCKTKKQSLISRKALLLAISYIPKMDF